MNDNIKNAYNYIIKNGSLSPIRVCPGPTGPTGVSEDITVRSTTTTEAGTNAFVLDNKIDTHHYLDFYIPKGSDGQGLSILGVYNNYDEFIKEHPTGNSGDAYLVNNELYIWNSSTNTWVNVGSLVGPTGPTGAPGATGATGPTGPSGPSTIRSAYLVTFNSNTNDLGLPVPPNERLPIDREELDISDIITLDSTDKTIQFNVPGYYKISYILSAYANEEPATFDPETDIVSVGFRLVGTDDVFIGMSEWSYTNDPIQLKAEGIISVPDISNAYELVNLGPESIYLDTPKLDYIQSESYFTNSLITIVIEYLGRQVV